MRKDHRLYRYTAFVVTGGCLLQLIGCASGLAPMVISLGESALLSVLFGSLIAP